MSHAVDIDHNYGVLGMPFPIDRFISGCWFTLVMTISMVIERLPLPTPHYMNVIFVMHWQSFFIQIKLNLV